MFAIYIDPAVCHTWAGFFIPECYGVLVMKGLMLSSTVAVLSAAAVRQLRVVRG